MDGISVFNTFVEEHYPQLMHFRVPECYWHTLCTKIKNQIFDAGQSFQLAQIDYEGEEKMPYDPLWTVIALNEIDKSDPNHIYLVDHAWTFKPNTIRSNLRNIPGLLERMCNLLQIKKGTNENKIEKIYKNIWRYTNTYAIAATEYSAEDTVPVWYVLDELGSGITYSDNPNFRVVPIVHIPELTTYTMIFPIENIEEGCHISRDFLDIGFDDDRQRDSMLIPWKHYEFDEDWRNEDPDCMYFLQGHRPETLPELDLLPTSDVNRNKLKVYSEYSYINQYLTAPEFEIVDNENDADILWYTDHFAAFQELSINFPHKFVNQFPFEYVITTKDLLPVVVRKYFKDKKPCEELDDFEINPPWLPTTYNLNIELFKFVSYYMQRKKAGMDNNWICKPYNLARGLDTYISNNMYFICRLPLTGPKVAQKYIDNPVLFNRQDVGLVKFDIRYVIMLKSVKPTSVYIYSNFFLRFANKPFALNNFDDYEQHFTVMNYDDEIPLYRMLCDEFKEHWAQQYPAFPWVDIEKAILKCFSELILSATHENHPEGIINSPQSRAVYAADVMLSWTKNKMIQPKLLEINWMPDCKRACEYYPDFYNDIFSLLFLNRDVSSCTRIL